MFAILPIRRMYGFHGLMIVDVFVDAAQWSQRKLLDTVAYECHAFDENVNNLPLYLKHTIATEKILNRKQKLNLKKKNLYLIQSW